MDLEYKHEFLARKFMVQFVYYKLLNNNADAELDEFVDDFCNDEYTKALFDNTISYILKNWDDLLSDSEEFLQDYYISYCAKAIFILATYEILHDISKKNLIINDYLNVSKIFCCGEKKILNKIIDLYTKNRLIS